VRIMVIGGDGMLGHSLLSGLSRAHEVCVTVRRDLAEYETFGPFHRGNTYDSVDVRDIVRVAEVVGDFRPEAIVNAAGIVKQREEARRAIPSIEVNALFPHRLAVVARAAGARLIHVSTDCVFSGGRGRYRESDAPDPVDVYGRTKLLGEVADEGCLTLRTSIIGLELTSKRGLVEWALSQSGEVRGYRRAIYSGVTTSELTRLVDNLLERHPKLHGVWHVASEPISKYDLLRALFGKVGRPGVSVVPDDDVFCDRSLDGSAFNEATGYRPMSWDDMLEELATTVQKREAATP
jgi:dTDP-4-dehydrorhamnose reductase